MVKNEIYNKEINLYPTEKKTVNQLILSAKVAETGEQVKDPARRLDGRFGQMKKIKRTKSAGIF
jgi:hypothetical protein